MNCSVSVKKVKKKSIYSSRDSFHVLFSFQCWYMSTLICLMLLCVPAQHRRSSQWGGAGCWRSQQQSAGQRTEQLSSLCPPSVPAYSGSRVAPLVGQIHSHRATPPPATQRFLQDGPKVQLCLFVSSFLFVLFAFSLSLFLSGKALAACDHFANITVAVNHSRVNILNEWGISTVYLKTKWFTLNTFGSSAKQDKQVYFHHFV